MPKTVAPLGNPLAGLDMGDAVDSVAHVIRVALTPAFLLSGIGTLLNVFNTRLGRVFDHREHVVELLRAAPTRRRRPGFAPNLWRLRQRK